MTVYRTNDTDLKKVADAIRSKGGTSANLTYPNGFVTAIQNIPTGITPSGNINITSTAQVNVTNYATAQVVDSDLVASNIKKDVNILGVTGTYEGGGSASIDTKSVTNSDNTATSISFTSMKGTPKAFFLRATSQISSSGSTTYYYITAVRYNGTNTTGNCFRIGSTRRIQNVTSGLSYSYSGTTLTISSSGARNTAPGSFYNGDYELVYIY